MKIGENQSRVFVCDDQMEVREALRLLLKSNGYVVETFAGPADLLAAVATKPVQLILVDMNYTRDTTSGSEGLDLIQQLQARRGGAPVIAMTAWGDIALAVEAMQRGASDFMEKPWSNDRLLQMAEKWIAAKRVVNREIEGARRVQQSLLPQGGAKLGGASKGRLHYACRFLPAREVSGDYYDFFEKKLGHFCFAMADVSGKGVPAAMLMANLQALFRSYVQGNEGVTPAELLQRVNAQFFESTAPESFATAFYGDYEEETGTLRYVNAGHPPVLLRRASGELEMLEATAMVIGAFADWHAETHSVQLNAGDRLLVYSDGAVEAQAAEEEFGEDRLRDLFLASAAETPSDALAGIEAAIQGHSGLQLFDDCTLFLLEPQFVGH